jgi:hypothetical protein
VYTVIAALLFCGTHVKENLGGGWAVYAIWGLKLGFGVYPLNSLIDLCVLILPVPFVRGSEIAREVWLLTTF